MPVCECLSAFALRPLSDRVDILFALATDHASDHSRRLLDALEVSNRKAWRALEVALAGESLWTWFDRQETKALRREIKAFVATVEFPELAGKAEFRVRCLRELRSAVGTGVPLGKLVASDLAVRAGTFARFDDPTALLAAEKGALNSLGAEAYHNAYRTKLEQDDYPAALADLRQAVALDPSRFARSRSTSTRPTAYSGPAGSG